MTFGEHLDELRVHLIRAGIGVVVAVMLTAYFGDLVVKILTEPVTAQLEPWIRNQLKRDVATFQEVESQKPAEERQLVSVEARLGNDAVETLGERLGVDPPEPAKDSEPFLLSMKFPVGDLLETIAEPLAEVDGRWKVKSLGAQEGFVIYFKSVIGASIVLASPWVFYQIYSFIAVGLYAHERRFVMLSLPFSVFLFLLGVLTCYFIVFPRMLGFFLWTNQWLDIRPDIRLNEWVGFSVILMLIFGTGFQLPLLMLLLERVGFITHEWVASKRRIAILILALVAAVVTPGGDPMTMIFLAVPLYLLFELGLVLMIYFRRHNPFEVSDPALQEIEAEI